MVVKDLTSRRQMIQDNDDQVAPTDTSRQFRSPLVPSAPAAVVNLCFDGGRDHWLGMFPATKMVQTGFAQRDCEKTSGNPIE
jgi:hypothetical protein